MTKHNHYVKILTKSGRQWLLVDTDSKNNPKIRKGKIQGKSLIDGKKYTFTCGDVVAFYTGALKEIMGLGMPYIPTADVCTILDTIVPDSMAYETHIACRVVQQIIDKPLQVFVAEKLHYTELELCKALSAEQVDAVALSIYNIEWKNQGMIIGDQTGIGKGRVAAAMIRYGYFNGLKPVFLSEKPNLFTDIYRDLVDIGSGDLVPFIVNSKEAKTDIKDSEGNVVHSALPKNDQEKIFKNLKFPTGYDFACATYSQFNSVKEKPVKPNFLRSISQKNLIIMDEAHNASGSSNTGEFMQEVLLGCKGVVFLSATFAKRPDNMPVYALKTCISEANMSKDELVDAIVKGGVALQEVLAAQLVSEGQMIRRERSFEGVEVNYFTLTEKENEHKAIFDNITSVLRDIIVFQETFVNEEVSKMDKVAAAEGKQIEERKGTSKAGVDNTPYFSKVFQVINQILFSLKAKSVAEMAIQRLQEGKKPIIAFSSTMESFLDDMQTDDGRNIVPGDTICIDFKTVLQKGLDGVMRYSVIDVNGKRDGKYFTIQEFSTEAQEFYQSIVNKIKQISTGISISPIDIIKDTIRKAGYTCDEVTGRKYELQIIEGKGSYGVLMNRKKILANDAFRLFNNNQLDCLMINQSGSTGASAHAIITKSVPREQVRQRVMIILQPELDINREVQKRGRINRTGQVLKPIYDYVSSCIPAEKRLMMMLRKKLKSLDANTTSNQKQSDNILHVDDFLNKYGDKIVTEYLQENKSMNEMIGDPLGLGNENKEGSTSENAASKVSGRVAVLSIEDQEKFYSEILDNYSAYVEYLKSCGQYDLEVEALNLEAETLESITVIEGKEGKSVFSENTNLETCEVNVLKKPFTRDELQNLLQDALSAGAAHDQQQQLVDECTQSHANKLALDTEILEKKYEKLIQNIPNEKEYAKTPPDIRSQYVESRRNALNSAMAEAIENEKIKSQNRLAAINNILRFFFIGKILNYPTFFNESVKAVCLGINVDRKKQNPFIPSAIKVKIAIANSDKYIDLTISGEPGKKLLEIMGNSTFIQKSEQDGILDNWEYYTRKSCSNRRKAFIVTGNILQGFSKFSTGKLVSFTTKDGSTRKGILLPENFDPAKNIKQGFVTVPIGKSLNYILAMSAGDRIMTNDGKIVIEKYYGYNEKDYQISVPCNKHFQDIFKDKVIMDLSTNARDGFEKRSGQMVSFFSQTNIANLVDYLEKKLNLSVTVSQAVYDEYFEKKKSIRIKSDIHAKAEIEYERDKQSFELRKANNEKGNQSDNKAKRLKLLKLKAKALELQKM